MLTCAFTTRVRRQSLNPVLSRPAPDPPWTGLLTVSCSPSECVQLMGTHERAEASSPGLNSPLTKSFYFIDESVSGL